MSDPLRILHLTLGADAGGLSHYIIELGTAMHALGHEAVVAGDTGAWQWAFDRSPLRYVQIPLKGGMFDFRLCVKQMREFLQDHPVDVIHTHYRRATLLARRLQRKPARSRPIPILYTVHLSHISLKFPRNLFTDFGDITHVASPEAESWVREDARIPQERIAMIPHGIDVGRYAPRGQATKLEARQSLKLSPDDVVAIYVGRLDWPKNEEWMVDLADAARAKIPNLKVILVGEGPHEAMLRERIARMNLADRVFLTGHRDPLACYQAADLLCLPSIREGFSLVCAEAMSVGVPALRTRTAGTRQLIQENVTGRSTPIDRDAFIAAAIEMLSDPEKLREMGRNASNLVQQNFTYQRQLDSTLALYRRLAKK